MLWFDVFFLQGLFGGNLVSNGAMQVVVKPLRVGARKR